MVVLGLGAVAEFSTVLDRLKTVLEIQNQSMEHITEEKKEQDIQVFSQK